MRGAFALLALALCMLLAACRHAPPEEALRATIAKMQADGEQHRVGEVMDNVAEDFGGPGGMDRTGLRRLLALTSLQNRKLGVTLGPLHVQMAGERATVQFTLAASGGSGGLLPDRGQIYEVTTGWRLEGEDWKLISASWKETL
jgi:hypothetical protein